MVDTWTVSDDKLTYTFTLRDALKFRRASPSAAPQLAEI
jgi:peptide/nickel transport system substrate-binding protein